MHRPLVLYLSVHFHWKVALQEAEEDLQSVLPDLKAAEKGLTSLKKTDLTEIRWDLASSRIVPGSMALLPPQ